MCEAACSNLVVLCLDPTSLTRTPLLSQERRINLQRCWSVATGRIQHPVGGVVSISSVTANEMSAVYEYDNQKSQRQYQLGYYSRMGFYACLKNNHFQFWVCVMSCKNKMLYEHALFTVERKPTVVRNGRAIQVHYLSKPLQWTS